MGATVLSQIFLEYPKEDVFFYQIHPTKFIPYLFNNEDADDDNVVIYKKRIQLTFIGISALFVIDIFMSLIGF